MGCHIVIVFGISHSAFLNLRPPNPFITELIEASKSVTNSTFVYEVDGALSNENETVVYVHFEFMSGGPDNEALIDMYFFLKDVLSSDTDSQKYLPLSSQKVSITDSFLSFIYPSDYVRALTHYCSPSLAYFFFFPP